jgi:hypothetical protein
MNCKLTEIWIDLEIRKDMSSHWEDVIKCGVQPWQKRARKISRDTDIATLSSFI